VVQGVMDDAGKELSAGDIWRIFEREYAISEASGAQVLHPAIADHADGAVRLTADVSLGGKRFRVEGSGTGPIDAFVAGLAAHIGTTLRVLDYHEHSIGSGADARAVAYLEMRVGEVQTLFGVGIDTNIVSASLKAIVSGLSRVRDVAITAAAQTTLA
jgi:2-isopropylmalate synthase